MPIKLITMSKENINTKTINVYRLVDNTKFTTDNKEKVQSVNYG